jgi:hypothetical protein
VIFFLMLYELAASPFSHSRTGKWLAVFALTMMLLSCIAASTRAHTTDDHAGYKAALDIAEKSRARQREIDRQQAEAVLRAEQAQAAGAPVADGAIQDDADPTTTKLPSVVAKSAGCPFEHDFGSLAKQGQFALHRCAHQRPRLAGRWPRASVPYPVASSSGG